MRTIIRNNYDPHLGDYHERIIQDEAREKTWLFDCDGVYLDITAGRGDVKVVNELGDSEVFATSQKLVTDELGKKQETLVAGDNITIEGNVISAGGGNYTAGYGLTLTGTEFAANTSVLATQTDLAGKQDTLTTAQLAAVNSGIDSTKVGQIATNTESITTVNGKIPAQASSENQLADKNFVNSSIATNTANFIGTFNSVAELEAYSGTVTNNDYAFVIVTDAQGNTAYDRYKYNGTTWLFEYELNNSSFTATQWAAINSGITSGDVTKLTGITAGAEPNTIDSISVNGTAVTPDANKNVDLTIDEGIKTLTTADYNYPANNPDGVAIWLLSPGIYKVYDTASVVKIYQTALDAISVPAGRTKIFQLNEVGGQIAWVKIDDKITNGITNTENGATWKTLSEALFKRDVKNNLTSTDTNLPLSANQGKVLNERIGDLTTLTTTAKTSAVAAINELVSDIDDVEPLSGSTAPTTSTAGTLGQTYVDTSTGDIYYLSEIDETTTPATYTWEKLATGTGVNVVQTTGTSTTDVMSQNATSELVYRTGGDMTRIQIGQLAYATPDGNYPIAIGVSAQVASSYNNGIAIGHYASSEGNFGLAIGSGTSTSTRAQASQAGVALGTNARASVGSVAFSYGNATLQGQFDIGTSRYAGGTGGGGYKSSNYRLLTGLYDPQSAHDAATKGYVDGETETYTIATTDWTALSSSDPYDYQATVTATHTIGANTILELLNDNAVLFATHGFAVGSVSSQSVVIYSVGAPASSVSLKINYKG